MPRDVRAYLHEIRAKDPMFEALERQMDDIVQRLFRRPARAPYRRRAWAPNVDVYETQDAYVAVVELAGVDPNSVTVEIEREAVAITGERAATTPPGCADYLQLEIPFGAFERLLILPGAVDSDGATANFEDGMLTVRLPKAHGGPKRVQVDIQRLE
jgi:HSP20 family protein